MKRVTQAVWWALCLSLLPALAWAQGPGANPPVLTMPEDLTTPTDTAATLKFGVDDPDVGANRIQICLYATKGVLQLAQTTGLRFSTGHGDGGANIVFNGTVANCAAAIAAVTYTPRLGYVGPAYCFLTANDLGNAGVTPALRAARAVRIVVTGTGWGVNAWGDTGDGQSDVPVGVYHRDLVSGGGLHTLAKGTDGKVRAWGNNWYGQCNVPADLVAFTVAAGGFHTLAVRASDGRVYAGGYNGYGQCNVPGAAGDCVAVAGSYWHSLALTRDGRVVAWGYNGYGQTSVPPNVNPAVAIACGDNFTAALRDDGTIVCWGDSRYGQCSVPQYNDFVQLACGQGHVVALRGNGAVVCWGADYSGQSETPKNMAQPVEIGAGGWHSLALFDNGRVQCWGANDAGQSTPPNSLKGQVSLDGGGSHSVTVGPVVPQLYVPDTQSMSQDSSLTFSKSAGTQVWVKDSAVGTKPVKMTLFSSQGKLKLKSTAGLSFSSGYFDDSPILQFTGTIDAVNAAMDGMVYTPRWHYGGLGVLQAVCDDLGNTGQAPQHAIDSTRIIVKSGGYQTYAWGNNSDGQTNVPQGLRSSVMVAAGGNFSLVLLNDGTAAGWGKNNLGQASPPSYSNFCWIAGVGAHSGGILSDGTFVSWGNNGAGQSDVPAGIKDGISLGVGYGHTTGVDRYGVVYDWGANRLAPPAGLDMVVQVCVGYGTSAALKADGSITVWGDVSAGQDKLPAGLKPCCWLGIGDRHIMGLQLDGTVVCWGDNSKGQCDVPQGLANVATVAGGSWNSMAALTDGTFVSWGDNTAKQNVPPAGLGGVTSIAGGGNFTIVVGTLTGSGLSANAAPTQPGVDAPTRIPLDRPVPASPEKLTLLVSPVSPQTVGTELTLTAVGGQAGAEYQFVVSSYSPLTRKWEPAVIRDFAASNTCTWTPAAAGEYGLSVNTRASSAGAGYKATAAIRFAVQKSKNN